MLAALLGTRVPPIVLNYGNQFMAATTTWECIAIVKKAAFITTSLPIRYQLSLSLPGQESVFDQLSRTYRKLGSPLAVDDPAVLNTTIIQAIAIIAGLAVILQSLPVAAQNAPFLGKLQQRLAIALIRLRSLGRLTPPPGWTDTRDAWG